MQHFQRQQQVTGLLTAALECSVYVSPVKPGLTFDAAGQKDTILDGRDKQRAEALIASRQRIHAGRMLSEHPKGIPDLRPEEAWEARAVADRVARCVLDWLELHAPAA